MARAHGFLSGALYILSSFLTNHASAQTTQQETSRPPLPQPFEFVGSTTNYFTNPNTNQTLTFQVGENITIRWLTDFELVNIYLNIGPELGSGQALITNSSETSLEWTVDDFGSRDEPCAFVAARAEEKEGPLDGFASIFFWIGSEEEAVRDDEDLTTTSRGSATRTAVVTKTAERANESGQSTMTASSDGEDDASMSQQMLSEETSTPVRQNNTMVSSTANHMATTSSEETSLPTVLTSGTSTRYVMEPSSTGDATLFDSDEETSDSKPSISTTSAAAIGLGAGLGLLVLLLGVVFFVAVWIRGRKRNAQEDVKDKYHPEGLPGCDCSRHGERTSPEMSEDSLPRGSSSPPRPHQQV